MVIQPMALVAAQGTCAQGQCCQSKTICHACKCCEVKTDSDLCGCCRGNEKGAGSCCTKNSERSRHDELFGEISDVVPVPPKSDDEEAIQEQVVLPLCMCSIRSEPMAPAPHRVPVPQVRDLVVIAYVDHVTSDAGLSIRPDQLSLRLPIGDHSRHFSQRFLCIWRI